MHLYRSVPVWIVPLRKAPARTVPLRTMRARIAPGRSKEGRGRLLPPKERVAGRANRHLSRWLLKRRCRVNVGFRWPRQIPCWVDRVLLSGHRRQLLRAASRLRRCLLKTPGTPGIQPAVHPKDRLRVWHSRDDHRIDRAHRTTRISSRDAAAHRISVRRPLTCRQPR